MYNTPKEKVRVKCHKFENKLFLGKYYFVDKVLVFEQKFVLDKNLLHPLNFRFCVYLYIQDIFPL